jgi:hypothetical protein
MNEQTQPPANTGHNFYEESEMQKEDCVHCLTHRISIFESSNTLAYLGQNRVIIKHRTTLVYH